MTHIEGNYIFEGSDEAVSKFTNTYISVYKDSLGIDMTISDICKLLEAEDMLQVAGKEFDLNIRKLYYEC